MTSNGSTGSSGTPTKDKSKNRGEVDLSNSGRGVWLVKARIFYFLLISIFTLLKGSKVHQRQMGEGSSKYRGGEAEDQEGGRSQAGRQVHLVRHHLRPGGRAVREGQAGAHQEQFHCQADP